MARIDEIIKKAKLKANDVSGRRATNEIWLMWVSDAINDLNREFKFKFKEATITVTRLQPALLPSDFLVIKSVYIAENYIPVQRVSYDKLLERRDEKFYFYAIEGNYIYTNFNGDIKVIYYSSDITIDEVPAVFDNLIVDYIVWQFYSANYPELEENFFRIYERNKFRVREDILNLETYEKL